MSYSKYLQYVNLGRFAMDNLQQVASIYAIGFIVQLLSFVEGYKGLQIFVESHNKKLIQPLSNLWREDLQWIAYNKWHPYTSICFIGQPLSFY